MGVFLLRCRKKSAKTVKLLCLPLHLATNESQTVMLYVITVWFSLRNTNTIQYREKYTGNRMYWRNTEPFKFNQQLVYSTALPIAHRKCWVVVSTLVEILNMFYTSVSL
jgi:hypothetical protein